MMWDMQTRAGTCHYEWEQVLRAQTTNQRANVSLTSATVTHIQQEKFDQDTFLRPVLVGRPLLRARPRRKRRPPLHPLVQRAPSGFEAALIPRVAPSTGRLSRDRPGSLSHQSLGEKAPSRLAWNWAGHEATGVRGGVMGGEGTRPYSDPPF